MRHQLTYCAVLMAYMSIGILKAQISTPATESIAVIGRVSRDSIILRWAPTNVPVWMHGNTKGYTIERYTLARKGSLLSPPEKKVLTPSGIRPLPESQWESIVKADRYAAIAAQAMFGDRFEVDLKQGDVFSIVNRVKENEQRLSFALFSADLSPTVAKASGLWFTDRDIKKEEKYLYRVFVSMADSLRGSIFINPEEIDSLGTPQNLTAEVNERVVSLRWEKSRIRKFTAYLMERSDDGERFAPISDVPMVTLSSNEFQDSRYEYAIDSLPDISRTYYYRVRGITPFGEISNPSEVVVEKGNFQTNEPPYITDGLNVGNKSIRLSWEFSNQSNVAIKGFTIERSSKPGSGFSPIMNEILLPDIRTYEDFSPDLANYYQVVAHGLNGLLYRSPQYFVQLVDSIPPAAPSGLKAIVDEFGNVELSWQPNPEPDLFGYRVYRANTESEELTQITVEPISFTTHIDKVNLNTLNEFEYYSVSAIDISQNQSPLSGLLQVSLPDKVKPQTPILLPAKSNEKGVIINWIKSGSEDVVKYEVYKRLVDRSEWQRLKAIKTNSDSIYQFIDEYAEPGRLVYYTVIAIDKSGLESDQSTAISASMRGIELLPPVQWESPIMNLESKKVVLRWVCSQPNIGSYQIYKGDQIGQLRLFRTIPPSSQEFTDDMPNALSKNYYRMMVNFINGSKSELSKELVIGH